MRSLPTHYHGRGLQGAWPLWRLPLTSIPRPRNLPRGKEKDARVGAHETQSFLLFLRPHDAGNKTSCSFFRRKKQRWLLRPRLSDPVSTCHSLFISLSCSSVLRMDA